MRRLPADDRIALVHAYVGDRTNRRHKPGRAFERTGYRFDVLGDYGAFRDLQRHRMLTIEWQRLSPRHGYDVPEPVVDAGLDARFDDAMERSAALHDVLAERFPEQAAYAVSLAYRMRYVMQMNAREAMHLCELRSSPQGHPSYRRIAQSMHRLIAEQAGHRAIAAAMRYVDHGDSELERLERRTRAPKRDASCAADASSRDATHAARRTKPAQSSRSARTSTTRAFIFLAQNPIGVDLHRRASVLVIVARSRLDSNGGAEAYYTTPPASTACGRELRLHREGAGRHQGVRRLSRRLSRERCDNPSAACSSGHPAAPPVSWTRPSDPVGMPTAASRAAGVVTGPPRAALYSAPPEGLHVARNAPAGSISQVPGLVANRTFLLPRGHRAR